MKEKAIEQYLVRRVKECGGWAVKGENCAGFPDRIVLYNGHAFFVELKAPTGCVSKIQRAVHEKMSQLGIEVWVLCNKDAVDVFIQAAMS